MKKVFLMAIAAVGMTFASCGNKPAQAPVEEAVDSTEVALEEANAAADEVIAQLTDAKDASTIQTALEAVKAKVAEFIAKNPELAKEYLAKVQGFLAENADKIKGLVAGNAAVAGLLDTVSAIPSESVDALLNAGDALKGLGIDASSLAGKAVDAAGDAVEGAKDAAVDAVKDAKDAAVNKAADAVNDAKAKAGEAVNDAKAKAGEAVDKAAADAKKKLGL
jgi:hypothetical protein